MQVGRQGFPRHFPSSPHCTDMSWKFRVMKNGPAAGLRVSRIMLFPVCGLNAARHYQADFLAGFPSDSPCIFMKFDFQNYNNIVLLTYISYCN